MKPWIVGLSGASGMRYGLRLIEVLINEGHQVDVVFSDSARRVLAEEEGINKLTELGLFQEKSDLLQLHSPKDIGASIASGSYRTSGMVVCPCSMSSLGKISHGTGTNLLHRAADVVLKEKSQLILVPRETPLSVIHLEHMLRLARLGAKIGAAMPGFYHKPEVIEDLIDMMVMKVLDSMGVEVDLVKRWRGKRESTAKEA